MPPLLGWLRSVLRRNVAVQERRASAHRCVLLPDLQELVGVVLLLWDSVLSVHLIVLARADSVETSKALLQRVLVLPEVFARESVGGKRLLPLLGFLNQSVYLAKQLLAEAGFLDLIAVLPDDLEEVVDVPLVGVLEGQDDHCIDGVVAVLVHEDLLEQALLLGLVLLVHQHLEDHLLRRVLRLLDQLLHHARGELAVAEFEEVLRHNFGDFLVDLLVVEADHFADDIISKLVVDEVLHVNDNLIDQSALLQHAACLQAGLHDAAALLVLGYLQAVADDGTVDGFLVLIPGHDLQARLDHVIAMDVDGELEDGSFHHLGELGASFVGQRVDLVEQLLERPGSVLVHGNSDEVFLDDGQNAVDLDLLGNLDELLAEIVGKLVHHECWEELNQHLQQLLAEVDIAPLNFFFDLLLKLSAARLLLGKSQGVLHQEFGALLLRWDLLVNLVELSDALLPLLGVLHFSSSQVHFVWTSPSSSIVAHIAAAHTLALAEAASA